VAVVLAKDVMNAVQKVSPEADRAGRSTLLLLPRRRKIIWVELAHYIGQKDFPPVRINLLTENQS